MAHYLGDWSWMPKEVKSIILETVKIVLVEHDRLKKIMNMVVGVYDAVGCRLGKRFDL